MRTCTADVGLTWLNKLALGAPIGLLLISINYLAYRALGDLIPTYPVCAVTTLGNISRLAFNITVNGPGQYLSVSFLKSYIYNYD